MILQAKEITKKYQTSKKTSLEVLKGVSLEISEGEIIAVVGPSGAGKSTLLHILGLLDRQTSGELFFNNVNIANQSDDAISAIRNLNIGFVFQFHHLLPEFSSLENVLMPALISGKKINDVFEKGKRLLSEVGLEKRFEHKPSELSGGEQQRVAVARALMNSPKIIFADEPSGNLDSENANSLHQLLFEMRKKYNQSFVVVTHNKELAAQADRIISIVDGNIV